MLSAANKTIDAFTIVRLAKGVLGEERAIIEYGILTGKVETLITLPFAFNIAFATTLIPSVASLVAVRETKKAKNIIENSIISAILIGLPCAIGLYIFATPILMLLFPNAVSGTYMLKLSSFSIILVVLIQTINGVLHGLSNFKSPILALGVGGVIKIILNLVLIPIKEIGVSGSILASLASYFIILIIMFKDLKKELNLKFGINKILFKPIIASTIMGMVGFASYNKLLFIGSNKSLILSIIISGIVYIILIFKLKILPDISTKSFYTDKRNTKIS